MENLLRLIALLFTRLAKLFFRRSERKKQDLNFYGSAYGELLAGAFPEDSKSREQLIYATKLFSDKAYTKSLDMLKTLLEKCRTNRDRVPVLFFTALNHSRLGSREQAIGVYNQLLAIEPRHAAAWSNLGEQYRQSGQEDEAIRCYRQAIMNDGQNAQAHNNLAYIYINRGQYEEAIPFGRRALELRPDLYYCAVHMAMAYHGLGDEAMTAHYSRIAIDGGVEEADLRDALNRITIRKNAAESMPQPDPFTDLDPVAEQWQRLTGLPTAWLAIGGRYQGPHQIGGRALGTPPVDGAGKPMRLLCALDCRELAALPDFPREGMLLFYIANDDSWGLNRQNPTDQTGFRVIYSPRNDLAQGDEPDPGDNFLVAWECRGQCQTRTGSMPMEDHRFRDTFNGLMAKMGRPALEKLPEDVVETLSRWFNAEGHRVGGYAGFNQGDPRRDPRYARYDTLLLQIEQHVSEEHHVHIRFGPRGGTCQFFIPKANLQARDFSDILYWWDEGTEDPE